MIRAASLLALLVGVAGQASADDLAAQLTRPSAVIEAAVPAAPITVFGHVSGGGDVIITVTGPSRPTTVRRKSRVAAVWLNSDSFRFEAVPSYYALLTSRPLDAILSDESRLAAGIGLDALDLSPDPARDRLTMPTYRAALARDREAAGLYQTRINGIETDGNGLFHATLAFPSLALTGTYHVGVVLVRDGRVVERRNLALTLEEGGAVADLSGLARHSPTLYGLIAAATAGVAGWLMTVLLRSTR